MATAARTYLSLSCPIDNNFTSGVSRSKMAERFGRLCQRALPGCHPAWACRALPVTEHPADHTEHVPLLSRLFSSFALAWPRPAALASHAAEHIPLFVPLLEKPMRLDDRFRWIASVNQSGRLLTRSFSGLEDRHVLACIFLIQIAAALSPAVEAASQIRDLLIALRLQIV